MFKKVLIITLFNVIIQLYGQITPEYTCGLSPYAEGAERGE